MQNSAAWDMTNFNWKWNWKMQIWGECDDSTRSLKTTWFTDWWLKNWICYTHKTCAETQSICVLQKYIHNCLLLSTFRQVTLFQELLLLKDFEKRENVLADRVTSKQQEKIDMQNKVTLFMKYREGFLWNSETVPDFKCKWISNTNYFTPKKYVSYFISMN